MEIITATEKDRRAWDQYVLSHPAGLAYHLYAWLHAVDEAYRFPGVYLMAVNEDGVCGVLPMVDFKIPLRGRYLVSLPYCDAGGVLADDETVQEALVTEAIREAKALGCKGLSLRQATSECLDEADLEVSAGKIRMLLALPRSSTELLTGFKSKLRSQIKKPIRDGLTTSMDGEGLVDQFYAIYARNMRDLGSPVHSLQWIRSIVSNYGERVRVGVVYAPDGDPVAAGIMLLHNRMAQVPWASSLKSRNHLNANLLLYWKFLEFAADNSFACFDFGRCTLGGGIYRFKKQWGAKPYSLQWVDLLSEKQAKSWQRAPHLRRTLEWGWQLLPVAISSAIGPIVRRYISL